jgi:hypothetical protein
MPLAGIIVIGMFIGCIMIFVMAIQLYVNYQENSNLSHLSHDSRIKLRLKGRNLPYSVIPGKK